MGPYNQDAWRMVEEPVKAAIDAKITAADIAGTAEEKAAAAVAVYIKGMADDLPAAADFIGQMFIKTGATNPGLYSSTGTTTPAWKKVTLAT